MAKKVQLTDNGVDIYPVTTSDVVAGLANVARTGSYNDLSDRPVVHGVPSGGTGGQVLKKASGTDYDVAWANESGSGLFVAEIGTTSYADVLQAYNAGKVVVAYDGGGFYFYTLTCFDGAFTFSSFFCGDVDVYYTQVVLDDEGWGDIYERSLTEIYWAEYGVTTYSDIKDEYDSGKLVLVNYDDLVYTLTGINTDDYEAYFCCFDGYRCHELTVDSLNHWVRHDSIIENTRYKVTSWSSLPSDVHYPSEKLVKDSLGAKYEKPSTGIPASDLSSGVQSSLDKADTALQSFTEEDPVFGASPAAGIQSSDITAWNAKYAKPANGIPASDLASGVIPSVPVQDVEVDGVSVLNDGVAELPAIPTTYAGSATAGGAADKALGIPYGSVDSDSTATDIKASVDNFPATLVAGVCAYIRNDVVASASGWTLNINGTGAKPVYASNADASRVTTLFSAATTFLFVYNPTRVSGGCWDMYYGYNANDNTIGYMLRTNGAVPPTASKFYRYRLLFTSDDYQSLIPANTSSSTNATAARAVNQAKINPLAPIYYYSSTSAVEAGVSPGASYMWLQYSGIVLGYSFNRTGSALTMTAKDPVFLKCAPQADGSAIMDADTPIVQALPSTEDGNIYIYLGIAESATAITLYYWHPIYWYKDGAIRQWTNAKEIVVDSVPTQGSTNPVSSGGVYTALQGKQNSLTFDSTPTSGSTNPVTSGGIYNVIGDIETLLAAI